MGHPQLVSVSGTECQLFFCWYLFSRTEITCSDLVLPTLMVSYNGGSPDNRPVNTGATYSCSNGYTLTGGDTTRVCVSGGSWSGSTPTCQGELCTLPPLEFIDSTYAGPTEPPPTTCPDLTVPANGVIIYSQATTPRLEGTMATQICLNGYVPSTTSTAIRVCGADRLWNGSALTCQCKYTMYSNRLTIMIIQAFCVQLGMVRK